MYDADGIADTSVLRMLRSLVQEMRTRYNYMKQNGYVQWSEYLSDVNKVNSQQYLIEARNVSNLERPGEPEVFKFYQSPLWGSTRLVLFIDELADLIYADREKTNMYRGMCESMLIKLSTLGRAAGIHLILGTQRPDATILSGQLRANIPTRIGLKCTNNMERRIILGDSCKDLGERVLFYNNKYRELVKDMG